MFLIRLIFFISFCSNLFISSIDTIIGLKTSSSVSLVIFTSLSFNSISLNSIKSFSNSKRLFLIFKNCFFVYCLSIFSQYSCFYSLSSASLHINKYVLKNFENKKYFIESNSSDFLSSFKLFCNSNFPFLSIHEKFLKIL